MKSILKQDLEVRLQNSLRKSNLFAVSKSGTSDFIFYLHPSLSNYHFYNLMFLPGPHLPAISPALQLPCPTLQHAGILGQLPTVLI